MKERLEEERWAGRMNSLRALVYFHGNSQGGGMKTNVEVAY